MDTAIITTLAQRQYTRHMATRPCAISTGATMTDTEIEAAWNFKEHRDLIVEINYELTAGSYIDDIAELLSSQPDLADSYYEYLWDIYWDASFNRGAVELIREASTQWLSERAEKE